MDEIRSGHSTSVHMLRVRDSTAILCSLCSVWKRRSVPVSFFLATTAHQFFRALENSSPSSIRCRVLGWCGRLAISLVRSMVAAQGRSRMKVPGAKIAPSMLSSDFANLASEAKFIEGCGADWLHMDVMDGHFVPNLTIGAPVIKSLRKHTKMFMDCHLMVTNPTDYVDDFIKAGASGFTFHLEVSKENWQELVHKIKAGGMRAGVALRPGTPIEDVFPLIESEEPVDMVLVMTVEPGFGGQSFMPETMSKVNALRRKFPHLDIEVDGGLSPATIKQAAEAGANCIVAGSAVFGATDPAAVITALRKGVDEAQASSIFFK